MSCVATGPVLGGLIAEARKVLGVSPDEFADLLGVTVEDVRRYEAGCDRPSPRTLRILTLLFASHRISRRKCLPRCWEARECPESARADCPAYRLNRGHMCWLLTGDFCAGARRPDLGGTIEACADCAVFKLVSAESERGPFRDGFLSAAELSRSATCREYPLCGMPRPARAPSKR